MKYGLPIGIVVGAFLVLFITGSVAHRVSPHINENLVCYPWLDKCVVSKERIVGSTPSDLFSGESMYPTIIKGECSFITMNVTDAEEQLDIGDVAVFDYEGENIAHRVIHECEGGYITKGDNNDFSDGCIPYEDFKYELTVIC